MLFIAGEYDPVTGKKIKKKKATRPGEEGPDQYEYVSDYFILYYYIYKAHCVD